MTNKQKRHILAMDIGGTHFRLGLVSIGEGLKYFTMGSTASLFQTGDPVHNLINYMKKYLARYGVKHVMAIAVGFPSLVSKNKKVIYSSPNLPGFNNVNVADPLYNAFQVPVFIENDVNFLLEYEIKRSQLTRADTVLGFFIGTGFGNAIYMNGRFLEGKNGAAGELGHIPVLGKSDRCSCGNPGCIELYASGKRLKEIKETVYPETPIEQLFVKHRDEAVLQQFVQALAVPIAIEINIFDPDHVIIGGGVIQMQNFPKEDLETHIFRHVRKPFPADNLDLRYAKADQTAGVLGAAYYALSRLGRKKSL